jgi:hypothetical protein
MCGELVLVIYGIVKRDERVMMNIESEKTECW